MKDSTPKIKLANERMILLRPQTPKSGGINSVTTLLLAVSFAGALSPNCFAQNNPMDEALRLARDKFGVTVKLGDVRQECTGPRAMAVNDWINRKGTSRAEAESEIERLFGILVANDYITKFSLARRDEKRLSDPFSNFLVCVSKISGLHMTKVGDDSFEDAPAHIASLGGQPAGGGWYFRVSQTQWVVVKKEDIKQYMEYADKKYYEIEDGKSKPAPLSKPAKGSNNQPVAAPIATASAANRPDPPAAGKLSQQQIATCSEDIRRTQLESQSWPGNANDVAARLGRSQKELFEGRCAAHPEAQAYIAGASKMLGYGGNSALNEGGSQTPLPSAGNQGSGGSTDPSRTRKVHNPAADARNCVQLIQDSQRQGAGTSGNWRFVNNCDSTVELFWCFVQDNGSCREGGTWTVRAGKGWPTFGNKPIKWGACRGRDGGGMDRDSEGNRYTCHLLHW